MIRKIKSAILTLVLAASFGFFLPNADASDSGPGVWDFLLFGNLDMGSNFNAGTLGMNSAGTTVYKGSSPITSAGYGFGFGTEVWFTDNIAARVLLQGNVFANGFNANLKNGPFFGYGAATIGPVFKLFGSTNYFVYAPVDLGYAITAASSGSPATVGASSSLTSSMGHSFYGDLGIGINVRLITIEAKVAYLPTPGAFGGNSFFFPISIGFDL
ncbi:hypothetical protein [Leptospirillum ferrooxidans]|uniref:Outer membrane protein beta-barrel domain-containing protein n=1 Tax=Leptospirillum ferrooxidans (strain C2-3) TaxID=1162668 RepID=I0IM27_LEPFC|nr:hypothetical protein [Leptospirillum ferrooxidans]BAM06326.1 hypothetical protein LFE_0610 [Leptospirillum ferrooxidans C2-3]